MAKDTTRWGDFDKYLEYSSKNQTLIGVKDKTLVDQATGEIIQVQQITKRVYGSRNFWKCYLMDFLSIMGILNSKQVDVIVYIMENTSQANNLFVGTYKKIAKDVGVSEPTIATVMLKLQKYQFIKRVQNGVWMINPNIMIKGNDRKQELLLSYYESEMPIEEITKARTKNRNTTKALTTPQQTTLEEQEENKE